MRHSHGFLAVDCERQPDDYQTAEHPLSHAHSGFLVLGLCSSTGFALATQSVCNVSPSASRQACQRTDRQVMAGKRLTTASR
jgi:hypothetical protein